MSLLSILTHTPYWVFGLFAALAALGISQCVQREVTLQRMTLVPLAMVGLSLYGTVSVFGAQFHVLALWAAAAAASALAVFSRRAAAGTRYDAARRTFTVPGSIVPLLLIMGIFCTKYGVNVALALHPAPAHNPQFAAAVSAVYGAFSGVFAARAARLWKLAAQGRGAAPAAA